MNKFIKLIASIGYILITIAIIFAAQKPATGYEASIYASAPFLVWVCLGIAIAIGIGITVYQTTHNNASKAWIMGLSLIILTNITICALPIIRGYYLWNGGGDTGAHLGIIQQLLITGHVSDGNVYPISHILIAQTSLILNIEPLILIKYSLLPFNVIFMVATYLFATTIFPNKGQILISTLAGIIMISPWSITFFPNGVGNLIYPLVLYILFNAILTKSKSWLILLFAFVALLPPLHPIPALMLCVVLLSYFIYKSFIFPRLNYNHEKPMATSSITLFFLLLIWTISWISYFGIWNTFILNIKELFTGGNLTHLQQLVDTMQYTNHYGYSVTQLLIKNYGADLTYIIISIIAFFILYKKSQSNNYVHYVLSLYLPALIIMITLILMYFSSFQFNPDRLLYYIIVLLPIFVGFMLHEVIKWASSNNVIRFFPMLIITIFFVIISLNSISILYPSPYTLTISYDNPRGEVFGWDWYLHKKNQNVYTSYWYTSISRHASYLLTAQEKLGRQDISDKSVIDLPFHLGYDRVNQLGQYYNTNIYVVLTELSTSVYTDIYPKMASIRATPSDFVKIETDPSVNKLYSNGEYNIYFVTTQLQ